MDACMFVCVRIFFYQIFKEMQSPRMSRELSGRSVVAVEGGAAWAHAHIVTSPSSHLGALQIWVYPSNFTSGATEADHCCKLSKQGSPGPIYNAILGFCELIRLPGWSSLQHLYVQDGLFVLALLQPLPREDRNHSPTEKVW